eukprot:CAMPEP_0203019100 /NCGR_PEP_ID=MMETSP1401-20130829/25310_1 /ASSEMBLY_ACC=CAM_ASM_000894 /TAXON_ID=38833 /ORGANISM="Micromonas pusilla, Strain CCAC1681" /LENGTH=279 /DNA_ID=CAMNT_0049760853 /DNA_START=17 /DNA_END=853 /DNA_ORIENTATION=-
MATRASSRARRLLGAFGAAHAPVPQTFIGARHVATAAFAARHAARNSAVVSSFALDGQTASRVARDGSVGSLVALREFRAAAIAFAAADVVAVPAMGDSITEGSIAAVLKGPGDAVEADEVIAQIETDKVTIDVRAPAAGTVVDVLVKEGDSVTVGQGVCTVEAGAAAGGKKAKKASKAPAPETAAGPPSDIEVPQMGDSITEGAVAALTKSPGDAVDADEVIAQIETDKVTIDVRAPSAGVLNAYKVGEGDTVTVGQALATFTPGGAGSAAKAAAAPP